MPVYVQVHFGEDTKNYAMQIFTGKSKIHALCRARVQGGEQGVRVPIVKIKSQQVGLTLCWDKEEEIGQMKPENISQSHSHYYLRPQ